MEKKWTNPWLIFSVLLIIVGIAIFLYQSDFFSGPLTLEEKTFSLGDKTISLLTPKGSEKYIPDPTQQIVSYGKGSKDIPMVTVSLLPQPPFPFSLDCKELKKPIIIVADITSLNKNVDVCEDPLDVGVPPEYKGYKEFGTSGFKVENTLEGKLYMIQVAVREGYFKTEEGMEKVRQIFESFNISE